MCGFATLDVVAGGSVEVVAGEDAATPVAVSVPLAAEGAEYIYYTFMTPAAASKLEDDEAKAQYLFDNGLMAAGESVDADSYDVLSKQMPETSLVLLAVATDSDGKYGKVLTHECATSAITYNELTVDYCKRKKAKYIIRGLRNAIDFQYEQNIAQINSELDSEVETVFLLTELRYSTINSSMVREILKFGGDVKKYLPENIREFF